MERMKHTLIALSILAPFAVGLLAVGRFAGWGIFKNGDVRSQADRLRAFGAR
jgi:hypothetical protein